MAGRFVQRVSVKGTPIGETASFRGVRMTSSVGAVVIGRNEGARLQRCLTSLVGQCDRIIYVDSGSTDGSVAFARGIGAIVVDLDRSVPFTAARARNEGFAALQAGGLTDYVQFVDGDCRVEPGWIAAGRTTLDAQSTMGIVTGWRTETEPHRNVYHEMCEVEWHRPPGGYPVLWRRHAGALFGIPAVRRVQLPHHRLRGRRILSAYSCTWPAGASPAPDHDPA